MIWLNWNVCFKSPWLDWFLIEILDPKKDVKYNKYFNSSSVNYRSSQKSDDRFTAADIFLSPGLGVSVWCRAESRGDCRTGCHNFPWRTQTCCHIQQTASQRKCAERWHNHNTGGEEPQWKPRQEIQPTRTLSVRKTRTMVIRLLFSFLFFNVCVEVSSFFSELQQCIQVNIIWYPSQMLFSNSWLIKNPTCL